MKIHSFYPSNRKNNERTLPFEFINVQLSNQLNMQNDLITSYIEKIIAVENNTSDFETKIALPDNSIMLAFQTGNKILEDIHGKHLQLSSSEVLGQLTKSKKYIYPPGSKTILIKLKPWAAGIFFQNNFTDLMDQNISFTHFVKKQDVENVCERLTFSDNTKEVILNFLQQNFHSKIIKPLIVQAINIINEKGGQIKVADLAYKVCNSKRSFERKFKSATGLTPEKFIANVRFQFALQSLNRSKKLTDIGYDCGYYDQSHFTNTFKSVMNDTPKKMVTEFCRISPISSNFIRSTLQHKLLFKNE